jgi:FlgD Ig-like domain
MAAPNTLGPVSSSVLVRVVFGLLVLATIGAFFVTQRLKREDPIVKRIILPLWLSPNGDGRKDEIRIGFTLPDRDEVTVSFVNEKGDDVRRLVDGRRLGKGKHDFVWDGRTDAGNVVRDGPYRLRVTLREEGRSVNFPRPVQVDTRPPRPRIVSVEPPVLAPGRPPPVRIRYRGENSPPAEFRVFRVEAGRAREVGRFGAARGENEAMWPAKIAGRPAPPGEYAFAVVVQDRALNAGSGPPGLPPTAGTAPEGTGVTVTGLRAAGPLEPVPAGEVARVAIGPRGGRFRWRLSRLGSTRPVREGRDSGTRLAFRVPDDTRTGLHVLVIEAAGRRALLPLAIRGRATGRPTDPRVLVVLPAITWQGRNPVDSDFDGFPDTLETSESVPLDRPFAEGRLPAGFAGEVAPLLRYLDRERLGYELTADLALARGRAPRFEDFHGVLFPGGERWLPGELNVRLRAYVESGGRLASFGVDSFRRRATVRGRRLVEPSAAEERNVFGEAVSSAQSEPAPLQVFEDGLGLFRDSDGFVGLFEAFEQSGGLVSGARRETSAGRDPNRPAFVAYRLGQGVVVRVGAPGWATALGEDLGSPEVEAATRRIWALISR